MVASGKFSLTTRNNNRQGLWEVSAPIMGKAVRAIKSWNELKDNDSIAQLGMCTFPSDLAAVSARLVFISKTKTAGKRTTPTRKQLLLNPTVWVDAGNDMISLGVQRSKEWAGVSGRILSDNGRQFGTGASDARRDRAEGWRQSEGGKPGGKRGGKGVQKGKGNRWHSAVSRF